MPSLSWSILAITKLAHRDAVGRGHPLHQIFTTSSTMIFSENRFRSLTRTFGS
jgi:hypothetical protein